MANPAVPKPLAARPSVDPFAGAVTLWLAPLYSLLVAIGTITLIAGAQERGNPMTADKAFFAAINAVTLTGFQQSVRIDAYKPIAQGMMLLLMSAGTILSLFVGGLAACRVGRLPHRPKKLLIAAVVAEWLALLVGMVFLDAGDRSLFSAAFQGAAAFGNCGLTLGVLPAVTSLPTNLVLMPGALLGGMGLPVMIELFELAFMGRKVSKYTQTILTLSAGAYLIGFAIIALLGICNDPRVLGNFEALRAQLITASALSIDCRTAGLPLVSVGAMPRDIAWALIPLMIVGACPGGTGGGLKLTSVYVLAHGIRDAAAGRVAGVAFRAALMWAGLYLALTTICFFIILMNDPQTPADQLFFTAISAASNVGLSHAELTAGPSTLFTLAMTMLLARVGGLLMAWWTVESLPRAELPVG